MPRPWSSPGHHPCILCVFLQKPMHFRISRAISVSFPGPKPWPGKSGKASAPVQKRLCILCTRKRSLQHTTGFQAIPWSFPGPSGGRSLTRKIRKSIGFSPKTLVWLSNRLRVISRRTSIDFKSSPGHHPYILCALRQKPIHFRISRATSGSFPGSKPWPGKSGNASALAQNTLAQMLQMYFKSC